jgi:hypothetical protein
MIFHEGSWRFMVLMREEHIAWPCPVQYHNVIATTQWRFGYVTFVTGIQMRNHVWCCESTFFEQNLLKKNFASCSFLFPKVLYNSIWGGGQLFFSHSRQFFLILKNRLFLPRVGRMLLCFAQCRWWHPIRQACLKVWVMVWWLVVFHWSIPKINGQTCIWVAQRYREPRRRENETASHTYIAIGSKVKTPGWDSTVQTEVKHETIGTIIEDKDRNRHII